jgi:hypothetical protein
MTKQKYYTLVFLGSDGKRKLKEIQMAKVFFTETFADASENTLESDTTIQKRLLQLSQANSSSHRLIAQRCLLCFISWQIERVCLSLEQQFGNFHGFTSRDLFVYVLDDDGSLEPSDSYQCLGREILSSFDPDKSSLSTWTGRKVRQHKDLNRYLLDCGLYLVSDWAILNDTKPEQLPRILREFHYLTTTEIEENRVLLSAYHKIYRADRLRQRAEQKSLGKCNPPTAVQLQAILDILKTQDIHESIDKLSIKIVMQKLQNLADRLREYRLHARNSCFKMVSIDNEIYENSTFVEQIPDLNQQSIINRSEEVDETKDFLKTYRDQMASCLDSSFQSAIALRWHKLQKKDIGKAQQFLTALQLFHCQRLSMSNIAKQLNLRAQDAVARLLKLKDFRADIRQQTLVKLQAQVIELAQKYSTPTSLVNLELTITELLDEQIGNVISQAEIEAASMQSNCQMSYFSQRLCKQIDNIKF